MNSEKVFEILQICESSSQPWPIGFYNPLTGVAIWSYKGSELNQDEPQDAVLVAGEYLLIPSVKKPLVVLVGLESKNRTIQRTFLSEPMQCIAVSSDGSICCGALDKNLYTWILSSGKLCSIVSGHFQSITKVAFASDDSKIVTAGKDGSILVWNLEDLLTPKSSSFAPDNITPWRKWNCHSLAVTDLKLGQGGGACRVYSVSLDQTAQIHDMASGDLLVTLRFDYSLTSCAVDNAENCFYVASSKGDIMRVSLSEEPVLRERHMDFLANSEDKWLHAHKQAIVCLSVNMDGTFLASGGEDNEVKVWHINSRQCIRTINCKGKPKRVQFLCKLPSIFDVDYTPKTPILPLSKIVNETLDYDVAISLHKEKSLIDDGDRKLVDNLMQSLLDEERSAEFKASRFEADNKDWSYDVDYLRRELAKTKLINKRLYDMCCDFANK